MKLITFSVWGSNHKFIEGAIANLGLADMYYPGWKCRIYCGSDVPMESRQELYDAGFQVYQRGAQYGCHEGLFWRFEPACEVGVEAFISRDCDSRLNPREAAAVEEWLAGDMLLHTMRDHYEHIVPILGGMWGCRHWPLFGQLLGQWKQHGKIGSMGNDQDFLKEAIWPLVKDNNCIQHDRYVIDTPVETPNGPFIYKPVEFFGGSNLRPFPPHKPVPKRLGEHVGARVWE
jgi:hypothetical protein